MSDMDEMRAASNERSMVRNMVSEYLKHHVGDTITEELVMKLRNYI